MSTRQAAIVFSNPNRELMRVEKNAKKTIHMTGIDVSKLTIPLLKCKSCLIASNTGEIDAMLILKFNETIKRANTIKKSVSSLRTSLMSNFISSHYQIFYM
ncbi:hypothetical protein GCM10011391_33190 [Pullulanibacillus camelliae]|uniref:Uncharacterized protein n=1 Tax=Pullulanibacillus camelliae TaxID=1707096 RepID=A0A8J2YL37_9BACL|nr:hypothetical protein GCM10011391_33190 [Pullulanibacillus camelliae]